MRLEELQKIIDLIDENEKNSPMTPDTIQRLFSKYIYHTPYNSNIDVKA